MTTFTAEYLNEVELGFINSAPLTDKQIEDIVIYNPNAKHIFSWIKDDAAGKQFGYAIKEFARSIERAHGIGV